MTTDTQKAGGGSIVLHVGSDVRLVNSKVTTTVRGGDENAGNIILDGWKSDGDRIGVQHEGEDTHSEATGLILLNKSRVTANAFEGRGGNIEIVAQIFLADADSRVDASSAMGIDGKVDIRSPVTQISGSLALLSQGFLSAASLLRERCAEGPGRGKVSSLIVRGRDGLPPEPGSLLPSPFSWEGEAEPPASGTESGERPASGLDLPGMGGQRLLPVGERAERRLSWGVLGRGCARGWAERERAW